MILKSIGWLWQEVSLWPFLDEGRVWRLDTRHHRRCHSPPLRHSRNLLHWPCYPLDMKRLWVPGGSVGVRQGFWLANDHHWLLIGYWRPPTSVSWVVGASQAHTPTRGHFITSSLLQLSCHTCHDVTTLVTQQTVTESNSVVTNIQKKNYSLVIFMYRIFSVSSVKLYTVRDNTGNHL